jgi:two-component system CheB/CheR fusion protein
VLADLAPIRRELRSRNGRWYEMRARPYRTVDDKIDGVVLTFVDISERHQVEQQLRESERRLGQEQHLVELSRDPIFVWDFDRGIVDWNRGSEELYGYTRAEALGKQNEKLLGTTVPGSSFAQLRQKLLQDGSWAGELRQRTKDGKELIVEGRMQLQSFDGGRLVLETGRDVTARRASDERQRLLMRELTHRVRNILTVIQAVARYTLRSEVPREQLVERFEGRLMALANAHTLLVQSDWKGADVRDLASQQLGAYATDNPDRVRLKGEPILLPPDVATPFGLVLHELATNAAKHGALSNNAGHVSANWTTNGRNNQRFLKFDWKEAGGPAVRKPGAKGFGSTLIDTAIPGAQVKREFRPEGFVCTIEVPLTEVPEVSTARRT